MPAARVVMDVKMPGRIQSVEQDRAVAGAVVVWRALLLTTVPAGRLRRGSDAG